MKYFDLDGAISGQDQNGQIDLPSDDPEDMVVAPNHYLVGGIETIDFIQAKLSPEQFIGYCMGNALKYLSRANHKGGLDQDVQKAKVYLDWAASRSTGKTWMEIRDEEL